MMVAEGEGNTERWWHLAQEYDAANAVVKSINGR
jgi:hypothetical protein